jgi:catechol 2,3-dioxygenase-like lactoylglutathione lyase family enzyme
MKRFAIWMLLIILGGTGAAASGADVPKPIVESLGHVGLAISNLQPALHFYIDQLGLTEAFRLRRPDGTPSLVYLRVADTNTFVELFPGTRSPNAAGTRTVRHIGFFVRDLQATLRALKARGYPLPADAFEKARHIQADNTFLYFIKDPDGNRIELSQLRPDSLQVTSRHKK